MTEGLIAFAIWIMVSLVFVTIGIYDLRAKEVVGFWSNGKKPTVKEEKRSRRHALKTFYTLYITNKVDSFFISLSFCYGFCVGVATFAGE